MSQQIKYPKRQSVAKDLTSQKMNFPKDEKGQKFTHKKHKR